jgi:acyl-CoA synthetase (AMP-forming)/AMP-acid ligase II
LNQVKTSKEDDMAESKLPGVFAFDMMAKAEEMPDFEVLTFDNHPYPDETLTYSELVRKGNKLAQTLKQMGFGRGDTLSVVMRNHPEIVIALYATSALSAILVPIDPRSKGEKLKYQIKDSDSKAVIFASEFMEPMEEALSGLPGVKTAAVLYKDEFNTPISDK